MEKKHILNSPRVLEIKSARQKKRKKNFVIFVVCFFIVLISLVALSRYRALRIYNIEVSGNSVVDSSEILINVKNTLNGYYFFVFPKNNAFLISEKEIKKNLELNFPRLTDINIEIKNDNTLYVNMAERKGAYTWCGEGFTEGVSLANTKCYFSDDTGFVFDEAPYFAGDVYFRLFGKLEGEDSTKGYFAKTNFANYILFKKSLEDSGLRPIALYEKQDGETEFYLKHEKEPPNAPKIIFNQKDDIVKIIENLRSALSAEPLKTDIEAKYEKLLYIDLRFGNKVYFKFSE